MAQLKIPDIGKFSPLISVGLSLLVVLVIYKMLQSLGIASTKESRQDKEEAREDLTRSYWSPQYWREIRASPLVAMVFKADYVAQMVKDLKNIRFWHGGWFKAPEKVFAIFQKCRYKTQVSFLADMYERDTGRSLKQDVYQHLLTRNDWLLLNDQLNALPVTKR